MRIVDIIYFLFLLTLSLDPTGYHSRLKDLLFVVLVIYGVIYCLKRRQYLAGINRVTLLSVILIPIWGMFIAFITDNLMPYLGEKYSFDYGRSTLFGHSQGGVSYLQLMWGNVDALKEALG